MLPPPDEVVLRVQARIEYARGLPPIEDEFAALARAERQRRTDMLDSALEGLLVVLGLGAVAMVTWLLFLLFVK